MIFDPFESRLCRDVRNQLGHAMIRAIETGKKDRFTAAVQKWYQKTNQTAVLSYIQDREKSFDRLFKRLEPSGFNGQDMLPLMWQNRLYFECHEYVEKRWLKSSGKYKKGLQALIFSLAALEHRDYGRTDPACRLAEKAVLMIREFDASLPPWADAESIIDQLNQEILQSNKESNA